jgi:hypothetical protein
MTRRLMETDTIKCFEPFIIRMLMETDSIKPFMTRILEKKWRV